MKRITVIVGMIMAIVLVVAVGSYGVGKAACGGTTGEGVSGTGTTGQGATGEGVSGAGATAQGTGGAGVNGAGVSAGTQGLGNTSSTGVRVGASMGKPQEYKVPGRLNINIASADDMIVVPGIDRKLANNIVEYRQSNGPFDTVDELMNVQGESEEKLEASRPFIKVRGASRLPSDLQVKPPKPNPFPRYSIESE